MADQGFLVISDISGYGSYVRDSELEHARDSLTALLQILIEHTQSPFNIAKLEGDAVFSYAPGNAFLQGQSLLEMMEGTYVAFRKALELMVLNTTCPCNACRNLPNLDLKMFVHYGKFAAQEMGAYRELLGADVNLLHRLLKNKISEQSGLRAYVAYTQAVVDKFQLGAYSAEMLVHHESFADVGEVTLYVQDLHGVWERRREEARIEVKVEEAFHVFAYDFSIPAAQLWEYVTMPQTRALLMDVSQQTVEKETVRTGEETVYVCVHGTGTSLHTVVDWRPFAQYTTHETMPLPNTAVYSTYRLDPIEGGTRLTLITGKPRGPLAYRKLAEFGLKKFLTDEKVKQALDSLKDKIDLDLKEGRLAFMPSRPLAKSVLESAVAEKFGSRL
ncbi:MAG: DUF2652 domain-containing protein [Anaerolineales bacterium]